RGVSPGENRGRRALPRTGTRPIRAPSATSAAKPKPAAVPATGDAGFEFVDDEPETPPAKQKVTAEKPAPKRPPDPSPLDDDSDDSEAPADENRPRKRKKRRKRRRSSDAAPPPQI